MSFVLKKHITSDMTRVYFYNYPMFTNTSHKLQAHTKTPSELIPILGTYKNTFFSYELLPLLLKNLFELIVPWPMQYCCRSTSFCDSGKENKQNNSVREYNFFLLTYQRQKAASFISLVQYYTAKTIFSYVLYNK